jgi:hypothetical protein
VICPDLIWRGVVLIALQNAAAIVLIPGSGEGLAWERQVVATSPELDAKTLTLSTLEIGKLKAVLKTHLGTVVSKMQVTLRARRSLCRGRRDSNPPASGVKS